MQTKRPDRIEEVAATNDGTRGPAQYAVYALSLERKLEAIESAINRMPSGRVGLTGEIRRILDSEGRSERDGFGPTTRLLGSLALERAKVQAIYRIGERHVDVVREIGRILDSEASDD